ncbi:hypothetical protein R1flu_023307 [Riccia fluitans]|uniref:Auxin efflux carrier component n=1 Tax=Riccia fluitans TaxID=41844 RepID=A0ABD1XRN2_9MARC
MLTAEDFWHLIEHMIPFYVLLIIGYGLTKLNLITPEHGPGISRWVSILAVPLYVFHLLAFTDPYQINLRLVGADVVSKALALICGCLWWKFSKSGSIEGVIRFFMLATLPNTVLIGEALLKPLYGDIVHTQVTTIIFMQSFLWYNVCISMYEVRRVLLEEKRPITPLPRFENSKSKEGGLIQHNMMNLQELGFSVPKPTSPARTNGGLQVIRMEVPGWTSNSNALAGEKYSDRFNNPDKTNLSFRTGSLERTISAPAGFLLPGTRSSFELVIVQDNLGSGPEKERKEESYDKDADRKSIPKKNSGGFERSTIACNKPVEVLDPESRGFTRDPGGILILKVINRLKKVPLTYASIAGFVYSLLARKYGWTMPYPVQTSLELISDTCIGMSVFAMGMAWASSGRLISCGWKALLSGIILRFLVGPILMTVSSKMAVMSGEHFRFAVLQAVIPQGVISFVLSKEYGVEVPIFITAVVFQALIFIPIVLCYYVILDAF